MSVCLSVSAVGILQSAEVLIVPTLKAMLAKSVPANERGKQERNLMLGKLQRGPYYLLPCDVTSPLLSPPGALFTLISVVQILSTITGSALYILVYILSLDNAWPPGHSGGASFLLMAVLYGLTIPLMW